MQFQIHEYQEGSIVVVDVPQRLTIDTADDLKKLLKKIVEDGTYRIIMDLKLTEYMDSSGLGAIVSKIAETRSKNGDIRLASIQKYIDYLLNLTHLNKILKCYDSVEEAVDSFKE